MNYKLLSKEVLISAIENSDSYVKYEIDTYLLRYLDKESKRLLNEQEILYKKAASALQNSQLEKAEKFFKEVEKLDAKINKLNKALEITLN